VSTLLDTSVLVDYLRGVEPAEKLVKQVVGDGEPASASVLTRIELSVGMRPSERRRTDALVAAIRWWPVDAQIADEADSLARRYGPSHSGIDAVDYCLAATARVHDLELLTLNVRHFPMFPGLEPPW